ncbi:hypothetical protein R1sor_016411 [Riccia sorocarpa]|uniref:Protein kinase domain-containing protein n=1 Tax=Riccia sorocarpa TaxID=122646 RepID=A0ABD3HI58_9MARC
MWRIGCRSELGNLLQKDASSKRTLTISLGPGVNGSVLLVIACILFVILGRMWKRILRRFFGDSPENLRQIQEELAKQDIRLPFYKYEELRAATKYFSDENVLGKGRYGVVYKAELADKSTVAVKLLQSTERSFTDFLKEIVLVTGIKHTNLVELKGCCVQNEKQILVYEFAENRDLGQALWGNGGSFFLNWAHRVKICVDVAKGLSYLHESKIIHRDIKPPHILLDKDWNAKIAGFTLALQLEDGESQAETIAGTLGYLSPEYRTQALITEKLDVYSYGIVLLEIISGRRCLDLRAPAGQILLQEWAFRLYEAGCLLEMAEKALLQSSPAEEIESVLKIAFCCLREKYKNRPAMSEVVTMLNGIASGVAKGIVDELREHPQVLFDNIYKALIVNSVNGNQEEKMRFHSSRFNEPFKRHRNPTEHVKLR